jgi:hypothetical protein
VTIRNQNVEIYRGNSALLEIDLTQADGLPYNPALGTQFKYRVSNTPDSEEVDSWIRKSNVPGGGIDPITGGVSVTINVADTTNLESGIYYHELKAYLGSDESTAMVGAFVVLPSLRMV